MKKETLNKLVLSAMFLAIGMVLPGVTMQMREIGNMLLPMHIPVMLCGVICGPLYGGAIGFVLPFLRFAVSGKPNIYPNAVAMAVELCVYAVVIGIIYMYTKKIKGGIFISLIASMLAGRIIWGVISALLYSLGGMSYTLELFLTRAFAEAVPGIIIQLILIPTVILSLKKAKILK